MSKKRVQDKGYADFVAVVQYALPLENLPDVQALEVNSEALLAHVFDMVEQGYRVQLAPNTRGAGYQASSMSVDLANDDAGLMLVAKAPTPGGALSGLVYKHFFLLSGHGYALLPTSQAGGYT